MSKYIKIMLVMVVAFTGNITFAGEPEGVARQVLKAVDRGSPVVYSPSPWRLIMAVIRSLPRAVMRRVGF